MKLIPVARLLKNTFHLFIILSIRCDISRTHARGKAGG